MSTVYRMSFNNFEEQAVTGTLTNEAGDLDIIDIDGAEDAIRIVTQDNEEDKFTPIKAKKCIFKFYNSPDVNLRTFATGEDNTWRAEVKINGQLIFIGWLEQGDITEPFLYQENQIVTLTAIDGLGYLDDIRLVGFSGDNTNNYVGDDGIRIIDWLGRALFRTGFQLNINVINNLREENNDDTTDPDTFGNIYATCNLFAKTFEDKIGEAVSCRKVLEIILGHDCFITQAKGEWWIVRVREYLSTETRKVTVFDYLGNPLSFTTGDYEKAIGLNPIAGTPFAESPDATAFFSLARTNWLLQRPYKSTKLTFNYQYPFELLCNSAFLRGDFIADLPDEVDPDGFTLQAKSYNVDCWTYYKGVPITTQDSDVYIKTLSSNDQEKQRFLHFPETAVNAFYYLACVQLIPVGLYDKFTLSFNVRYSTDFGSLSGDFQHFEAWARLYADDGTFWSAHGVSGTQVDSLTPGNYWVETGSDWLGSSNFTQEGQAESIDFTQWQSLSFDVAPMPRSGKLEIILINQDVTNTRTKDYSSLSFEYNPYINGNYKTYSGQSYKSTQPGDFRRSLEEEVFMSNAPRTVIKGAILVLNDSSEYELAGQFYEGLENTSPPATLYDYGELQERAFQNQHRNSDEVYRATCQGLTEGEIDGNGMDDHQDLIHKYYNRDTNPGDNDKVLQLVTQDVDVRNCEWTGTLILNSDESIGEVLDPIVFQYEADGSGSGGSGGGSGGGGTTGSTGGWQDVLNVDSGLTTTNVVNISAESNFQWFGDVFLGYTMQITNTNAAGIALFLSGGGGLEVQGSSIGIIIDQLLDTPNSLGDIIEVRRQQSSGTPAVGFGSRFLFGAQDDSGLNVFQGSMSYEWSDATAAAVTSLFRLKTVEASVEQDAVVISGNGNVQFSQYGAGTLTTDGAGNITAVSDERLKDVKNNYKTGLEAVMAIQPIVYKWKDGTGYDTRDEYIGFSAQNIRDILGDTAVGKDKKGNLMLQDRAIIAVLVNAIHDLQNQIKQLWKISD